MGDHWEWVTLGTGFLCGAGRLVTCAHVIEDPHGSDIARQHVDTDHYALVSHDDEGNWQYYIGAFQKEVTMFVDVSHDLAFLYLGENFYHAPDGAVVRDKREYIRVGRSPSLIGNQVGVLGYPLVKLEFESNDIQKPKLGDVILRADLGVVNARYAAAVDKVYYDYTMAFNPGNSGGPVFDTETGRAIALVQGFKTINILTREVDVPTTLTPVKYGLESYISNVTASYSVGIALFPLEAILSRHGVSFE
jgi:hypothetical protein